MPESEFAGKYLQNITVPILFYAYPGHSSIALTKKNGTPIQDSAKYTISIYQTIIEDNFYGNEVALHGHCVNFTITDLDENDLTEYHLQLLNGIGLREAHFTVISESKFKLKSLLFVLLLDAYFTITV